MNQAKQFTVRVTNKNTGKPVAAFHGSTVASVQAKYDHYKATQVDHKLSGLKAEIVKRVVVDYGQGPEWEVAATKGGSVS